MEKQEYISIEGSVEGIIYANKETGFTVIDINVSGELVCAVGQMLSISVGEEVKLTGYYTTHPNFGLQFKVEMYERSLPATSHAICKYLSSGVIKGIGPATARRIVDKFGDDTLKIIEGDPLRLAEISGITKAKAEKLAEDFKKMFGIRTLMLFLSKQGINPMQSVLIYNKWGTYAIDIIKDNPYVVCSGDFSIDFSVADNIAKEYDIPVSSPKRVFAGICYVLNHNLNNGHTCLPKEKLIITVQKFLSVGRDAIETEIEKRVLSEELYSYYDNTELIFLPEYYESQKYIVSRLHIMLNSCKENNENIEPILQRIESENKISYAKLQRKAIIYASRYNAFILTGGPGTGKTTAVNGIIEVLEQNGLSVALAAPTGRAAKRLSEVTGREAKTIHRLLEVAVGYAASGKVEFVHNQRNPLIEDAVIIDEMSMIDTTLFYSLLKAMKQGAKLVMVGDFHQLPSVGAGNILRDMMESDVIPTVELSEVFRQAAKSSIVTNAHAIVSGEIPDLSKKDNDFFFIARKTAESAADTIVELCEKRLPAAYGFSPFDDIQVLCPSRKGSAGSFSMNGLLQTKLNPKDPSKPEIKINEVVLRLGDKVMQIKNNYDISWSKGDEKGMGIFNGDIGIIKMVDKGSRTVAIDFDGRLSYYSFDMLNQLELAYAVTVHKSQGSEFDAIVIPVIGGYDKLYFRNLLYTAVTRAKKILVIVGSSERVEYMIRNDRRMLRYTGMSSMLKKCVYDE